MLSCRRLDLRRRRAFERAVRRTSMRPTFGRIVFSLSRERTSRVETVRSRERSEVVRFPRGARHDLDLAVELLDLPERVALVVRRRQDERLDGDERARVQAQALEHGAVAPGPDELAELPLAGADARRPLGPHRRGLAPRPQIAARRRVLGRARGLVGAHGLLRRARGLELREQLRREHEVGRVVVAERRLDGPRRRRDALRVGDGALDRAGAGRRVGLGARPVRAAPRRGRRALRAAGRRPLAGRAGVARRALARRRVARRRVARRRVARRPLASPLRRRPGRPAPRRRRRAARLARGDGDERVLRLRRQALDEHGDGVAGDEGVGVEAPHALRHGDGVPPVDAVVHEDGHGLLLLHGLELPEHGARQRPGPHGAPATRRRGTMRLRRGGQPACLERHDDRGPP